MLSLWNSTSSISVCWKATECSIQCSVSCIFPDHSMDLSHTVFPVAVNTYISLFPQALERVRGSWGFWSSMSCLKVRTGNDAQLIFPTLPHKINPCFICCQLIARAGNFSPIMVLQWHYYKNTYCSTYSACKHGRNWTEKSGRTHKSNQAKAKIYALKTFAYDTKQNLCGWKWESRSCHFSSETAHGPLSLAIPKSLLARITLECCRVSEYWKLAFPLGNASWKVSAGLQRVAQRLMSALYNRILFNCMAF